MKRTIAGITNFLINISNRCNFIQWWKSTESGLATGERKMAERNQQRSYWQKMPVIRISICLQEVTHEEYGDSHLGGRVNDGYRKSRKSRISKGNVFN